ncbi:Protein N-terminal glutamine amidohydrolase [Hypsizygus marmoreus]|uniref:Protein N-terminal glutamine amidohydrolase n=1 Tax=Hypsizygus marmoreus TaxID=39966 RepID=A0A369JQK8_HYPMA|nr:Protein N-terminal glutamine amidohydrolase [Hypsizygus marmoreus]
MMLPPSCPISTYTSCYCEENIYLLAQQFSGDPKIVEAWDIFVVFISNNTKTVALWNQKLAHEPSRPVVWDYHVLLVLRPHSFAIQAHPAPINIITSSKAPSYGQNTTWAYDFDTQLDLPCTLEEYLNKTFMDVDPRFQSLFRVIPGNVFLDNFASDRSHMLLAFDNSIGGPLQYSSPPPLYAPICGAVAAKRGITHNLMSSFVSMDQNEESYGIVLDRQALYWWIDDGSTGKV